MKLPCKSVVVPTTNAESGKDNATTLAYGRGTFFSSVILPIYVDWPYVVTDVNSSNKAKVFFISLWFIYLNSEKTYIPMVSHLSY